MCNTFIEKNVTRVKREYFFVFAKPLVFYFSLLFFFFPPLSLHFPLSCKHALRKSSVHSLGAHSIVLKGHCLG